MTRGRAKSEAITDSQRRALFAWARRRGLELEDLRAATPAGSVSLLTRGQAAELLELISGRPQVLPRGNVTPAQLGLIEHLQQRLGYSPAHFNAWLAKYWKVNSLESVTDRSKASHIIAALMKTLSALERKRQGIAGRPRS